MRVNEKYFESWTPKMAYILGFITADGGMHYSGYEDLKYNGYKITIPLKYEDKEILEFIRDEIAPKNNVYDRTFGELLKSGKRRHQCSLTISSKYLMDSLMTFGITPRKTGKEVLPFIPHKFKADYLRGLFDGDGSISISTQKQNGKIYGKYTFKIVSANKKYLEDVKFHLGYNAGGSILEHDTNCYKWQLQSKEDIIRIGKIMYYEGFPFALKRKYHKFLELN